MSRTEKTHLRCCRRVSLTETKSSCWNKSRRLNPSSPSKWEIWPSYAEHSSVNRWIWNRAIMWADGCSCNLLLAWPHRVAIAVDLRSSTIWLADVRVFGGTKTHHKHRRRVWCWRTSCGWPDATSRELGGCSKDPCSSASHSAERCSNYPWVCGGF